MAGRGRASSQKRHKEQVRMERRQEKAVKKVARSNGEVENGVEELDPLATPQDDVEYQREVEAAIRAILPSM